MDGQKATEPTTLVVSAWDLSFRSNAALKSNFLTMASALRPESTRRLLLSWKDLSALHTLWKTRQSVIWHFWQCYTVLRLKMAPEKAGGKIAKCSYFGTLMTR